jgi:FKBP-type peptidyl-prolyl cis-trans isomerase
LKQSLIIIFVGVLTFSACKAQTAASDSSSTQTDSSYAFGMLLAQDFKGMNIPFNYEELKKGFQEYVEEKPTRFSLEEAIDKARTTYTEAANKQNESLKQEETEFLAANKEKPGIQTTASGLQYEVVVEGSGPYPQEQDTVQVHYEGKLINDTVFDSSYNRGEPTEFPLNGVIPGWAEGIQLMPVGSTYNFYIPSELGYGVRGAGMSIPPYATLIFKVELLSIVEPPVEE